ncbi:substrate-binding periplasmic protein [Aliagarivorans taiwanensis]|uniref:substrate-binding periplasmic protein n=1 Tax=Aliagarivorans taiwanensis TaxID=561966 RepID=UPI0012FB7F2E|nr:transporter substrate-binding domain-containing protein [Aliagarivorans taiwanensis]
MSNLLLKKYWAKAGCITTFGVTVMLSVCSGRLSADTLQLSMHPLEPFQYSDGKGEPRGFFVDVVECALDELDQQYQLSIQPLSRVLRQYQDSTIDGFFLAAQTPERDEFGQLSAPISTIERELFSTKELREPLINYHQIDRIGVLRNSALHRSLEQAGFSKLHPRANYHVLFEMMQLGRLDIVAATDEVYRKETMDGCIYTELYRQVWDTQELGVYFTHDWLKANPAFLDSFNATLPQCIASARAE